MTHFLSQLLLHFTNHTSFLALFRTTAWCKQLCFGCVLCYCVYVQALTPGCRCNANDPGNKHTVTPLFFQVILSAEIRIRLELNIWSLLHESFALKTTSGVKAPLTHPVLYWEASAVFTTTLNLLKLYISRLWAGARTPYCSSVQSPLPSHCQTGCPGANPCVW